MGSNRPEITHGVLNKIAQAKKQYVKAKEAIVDIDTDWKLIAETIKTAFEREKVAYLEQRSAAMEELKSRKEKLVELQETLRRTALTQ